MRQNEFWRVDGVTMPTPDTFKLTEYDLDAATTGRPESGYLNRDRVRASLHKYDFTFNDLTEAEAKLIRNAIMPAQFSVEVRFLSDWETTLRTMYAGDKEWEMRFDDSGRVHISLTVTLSEY